MNHLRYYHFRTSHVRDCAVLGFSVKDAVADLRAMLFDGETIVGWA